MTPADIQVEWPTAGEIAAVLCAASCLEGDDPIAVAMGRTGIRSRAYAVIALAHQFPTAPRQALGRLCGNDRAATGARTALRNQAWPWFSLDRLNEVRLNACGWPPITLDEALTAPLIYCGRSWTDYIPQTASIDERPPVTDAASPSLAGSEVEEEPAPIEARNVDPAPVPGLDVHEPVAGHGCEKGPAPILDCGGVGRVLSDDALDEQAERLEAEQERLQQEKAEDRAADVARRLAWQAERREAETREREQETEVEAQTRRDREASVERRKAWLAEHAAKKEQPKAPKPVTARMPGSSPVAAAIASGARQIQEKKASHHRPPASAMNAFRAADLAGEVSSFWPDAPAAQRGLVIVPLEGEPPPGRSALDARNRAMQP